MSEVVHYKGKLKHLKKLENETLEEQCKRIVEQLIAEELDIDVDFYDSYIETLLYEVDCIDYVVFNNELYQVISQKYIDSNEDIFMAIQCLNDTVDYEVQYYNGGCSFTEALGYALENL